MFFQKHENLKKRAYEQRIYEVEHGSFTPLVFSATGGMGNAARIFTSVWPASSQKNPLTLPLWLGSGPAYLSPC